MNSPFIQILGFNSSLPNKKNYHSTSQILYMGEEYFLIDCGEGTQIQLMKSNIKINKINNIFITHLHGDHYFGLIGILSTFKLLKRKNILNIYSPKGLKNIISEYSKWSKLKFNFKINFFNLSIKKFKKIYKKKIKIYNIPLKHTIYTNGFLFKEKKKLKNLKIEKIKKIKEIQIKDYINIKKGKDFILKNGKKISNKFLTYKRKKSLSFAFCTDTIYSPNICKYIKNVDLLYHESTFLKKFKKLALSRGHSTSIDAALIAKKAKVKKLLLGHFSNRFPNFNTFLKEAKTKFKNTIKPILFKKYFL